MEKTLKHLFAAIVIAGTLCFPASSAFSEREYPATALCIEEQKEFSKISDLWEKAGGLDDTDKVPKYLDDAHTNARLEKFKCLSRQKGVCGFVGKAFVDHRSRFVERILKSEPGSAKRRSIIDEQEELWHAIFNCLRYGQPTNPERKSP